MNTQGDCYGWGVRREPTIIEGIRTMLRAFDAARIKRPVRIELDSFVDGLRLVEELRSQGCRMPITELRRDDKVKVKVYGLTFVFSMPWAGPTNG